jgi:hypothetical protein
MMDSLHGNAMLFGATRLKFVFRSFVKLEGSGFYITWKIMPIIEVNN